MGSTTASEKEKGFRLLQAQRARKAAEVRDYRGKGAGPKIRWGATKKTLTQDGTKPLASRHRSLFGDREKEWGCGGNGVGES